MLKSGLQHRGFHKSVADPCVFIKSVGSQNPGTGSIETTCDHHTNEPTARFISKSSDIIVLVYVDDCIILSRDKISIELFIASLKHGPEGFDFTNEGTMDKYLGVNIERLKDNIGFTMSQPYLIERIMQAARIDLRMTNSRPTSVVRPLLSRNEDGTEIKTDWNYEN